MVSRCLLKGGPPGEARTPNPRLRRPMLYPIELRAVSGRSKSLIVEFDDCQTWTNTGSAAVGGSSSGLSRAIQFQIDHEPSARAVRVGLCCPIGPFSARQFAEMAEELANGGFGFCAARFWWTLSIQVA